MEEQILKIINESFIKTTLPGNGESTLDEGYLFDSSKAAKEISAMMERFITWIGTHTNEDDWFKCDRVTGKWFVHLQGHLTPKELFTYWLTNIENKSNT